MYDLDIHEAAMGKTLAEIIDVGRTLYTESQLIGEAADLLLQLIETEPIPHESPSG
jgi:hypothetical protein